MLCAGQAWRPKQIFPSGKGFWQSQKKCSCYLDLKLKKKKKNLLRVWKKRLNQVKRAASLLKKETCLLPWTRRREREGSNEERLRDWLCLRRPCPLVSQIALTVYITFGLRAMQSGCCLPDTPEPFFWRNTQHFCTRFF